MDSKKPWQSKTLWTNFLIALATLFIPGAEDFIKAHTEMVIMGITFLNTLIRLITQGKVELK